MIKNLFSLLRFAKQIKQTGEYTAIALGKHKYPEGVKEAFRNFNRELWHKTQY